MNAANEIGRREFLNRTSSALGGLALGAAAGGRPASGAESGTPGVPPDRAALEKLIAEMEPDGLPYLRVAHPDGHFVNLLVKAARAASILELGTAHGYFAIWLSAGLEETGGQLTTIEILPDRAEVAKQHLAKAGLAHRVTFHTGDAHGIVPTLTGPFDLVLLNADKGGQADYFNKLYPKKLAAGGLIVACNAISQRGKMKDYLDLVGQHPDFDTVTVSATRDDGFAVSYRKRK